MEVSIPDVDLSNAICAGYDSRGANATWSPSWHWADRSRGEDELSQSLEGKDGNDMHGNDFDDTITLL